MLLQRHQVAVNVAQANEAAALMTGEAVAALGIFLCGLLDIFQALDNGLADGRGFLCAAMVSGQDAK